MNTERIEAAAKAAYVEYSQEPDFDAEAAWEDMRGTGDYEIGIWSLVAQGAIAAADALMFSDEAIERAAEELWDGAAPDVQWDHITEYLKERTRIRARAVVAALKGEQ